MKEDAFDLSGETPKLLNKPKFSLRDFQTGRANKECYGLFFTKFLPCLEKKTVWNRKLKTAREDKDLITISSEAFALLVIENQWKRWLHMFELSSGKVGSVKLDENVMKKPKYTRGGIWYTESADEDSKIGVQRGWSAEGIQRYNHLLKMVAVDRRTHKQFFPNWLQGMKQAAIANEQASKKTRVELGSNEAGANWSLEEDEEAALTNEVNTRKAEVINQRVAAKKAASMEESGNGHGSGSDESGNQSVDDESKDGKDNREEEEDSDEQEQGVEQEEGAKGEDDDDDDEDDEDDEEDDDDDDAENEDKDEDHDEKGDEQDVKSKESENASKDDKDSVKKEDKEEKEDVNDDLDDDSNPSGKDDTSEKKQSTPAQLPPKKSAKVSKKRKAASDVQTRTSSKKTRGSKKK